MSNSPYRVSPTRRFELRGGIRVQLSFLAMGLVLVVAFGFARMLPDLLFVGVSAPVLLYVFCGGPRWIEVSPDRVVISYWLRRTRVIPTHTLQLQHMDDELVFIDDKDTFGIENALFEPGDAHRCAEAIGAVARKLANQS